MSFLAAFLAAEDENAAEREATEKRFSIVLPPPPSFFAPSSPVVGDEADVFLDGAAVDMDRLLRFDSTAGGADGAAEGGTKIIAAGLWDDLFDVEFSWTLSAGRRAGATGRGGTTAVDAEDGRKNRLNDFVDRLLCSVRSFSLSFISPAAATSTASSDADGGTNDFGLGLPNPESNSKGGFSGSARVAKNEPPEDSLSRGEAEAWNGRRRFVGESGVFAECETRTGEVGRGGGLGNRRAKPRMASETSEEIRPPREGRRAIGVVADLGLVGEAAETAASLALDLDLVGEMGGAGVAALTRTGGAVAARTIAGSAAAEGTAGMATKLLEATALAGWTAVSSPPGDVGVPGGLV